MDIMPLPVRHRKLISLTPLIDVVFILLLFFMLTSTFLQWRALEVTTSRGEAGQAGAERSLLLRIIDNGQVDISGTRIPIANLGLHLGEVVARRPGVSVAVDARVGVSLQTLINVLDILEASEVSRYDLVTQ